MNDPGLPPEAGARVRWRSWLVLAGFVALCMGVSALGGLATFPSIPTWYAGLAKPAWTPPNWVFGPVWTVLYLMMAVAAWRVWLSPLRVARRRALARFLVQLGLNLAWSWLFFAMRSPWLGIVDIVLLWLAVVATMLAFRPLSPLATWLMAPYLLWVTYASTLNAGILVLNR